MAGSSSNGMQRTEDLLWASVAGSVRAGAKTGTANSTLRTTTRVGSSYSRRLYISNQENKEEKSFSFGPVPTKAEAEDALSALQRLFFSVPYSEFVGDASSSIEREVTTTNVGSTELVERVSAVELGTNMTVSARQLDQPKLLQSQGVAKVFETFRSMVSNPVVQNMVVSLSSDKVVWDAVMKNKVVQEIQESFHSESTKPQNSEGRNHDIATIILRWILESTMVKVMEFVDKITKLVNELFHTQERESPQRDDQEREKNMSNFDQVVRSAFMISVMVFMVVIVTRMK